VNAVYKGQPYGGETCLHIAVVKQHFEMVKFLISEAKADLRTVCATGSFFQPGSDCYYGEYVLSFAAVMGDKEIVEYLLDNGADMNAQDSHGNSVMHILVYHDAMEMYDFLYKKGANTSRNNRAGFTPLQLSVMLGKTPVFRHLVELRREMSWKYGPVTCYKVLLDEIDSLSNTKKDSESCLEIALRYHQDEVLSESILRVLLEKKWKSYAQFAFFVWLSLETIYIVLFSASIFLHPLDWGFANDYSSTPGRLSVDILVIIGAAIHLITQFAVSIKNGLVSTFGGGARSADNLMAVMASITTLIAFICQFKDENGAAMFLFAVSAMIWWAYYILFARGFKLMGPYIIMIFRMVSGDFFRFGVMYAGTLMGFSEAFFILFRAELPEFWGDSRLSVKNTCLILFGGYDWSNWDATSNPDVGIGIMIIFNFITVVLLLNLLIAMMGNTFSNVISNAEREWRMQWADIILFLEGWISKKRDYSDVQRDDQGRRYLVWQEGPRDQSLLNGHDN